MSDERLPGHVHDWLETVMACWPCHITIVSRGGYGSVMAIRGQPDYHHQPAIRPDGSPAPSAPATHCAAFLDGQARGLAPAAALERATRFATATLAHTGGAEGHQTATELDLPARTLPPAADRR